MRKKWRRFVCLAVLTAPALADEAERKRPVALYANEDLARVRPASTPSACWRWSCRGGSARPMPSPGRRADAAPSRTRGGGGPAGGERGAPSGGRPAGMAAQGTCSPLGRMIEIPVELGERRYAIAIGHCLARLPPDLR